MVDVELRAAVHVDGFFVDGGEGADEINFADDARFTRDVDDDEIVAGDGAQAGGVGGVGVGVGGVGVSVGVAVTVAVAVAVAVGVGFFCLAFPFRVTVAVLFPLVALLVM